MFITSLCQWFFLYLKHKKPLFYCFFRKYKRDHWKMVNRHDLIYIYIYIYIYIASCFLIILICLVAQSFSGLYSTVICIIMMGKMFWCVQIKGEKWACQNEICSVLSMLWSVLFWDDPVLNDRSLWDFQDDNIFQKLDVKILAASNKIRYVCVLLLVTIFIMSSRSVSNNVKHKLF